MARVSSEKKKDLFVDACSRCGGVWYDGGEVELLLKDGYTVGLVSRLRHLFSSK
jgi:Zn-finger nucleic acid-binding protein